MPIAGQEVGIMCESYLCFTYATLIFEPRVKSLAKRCKAVARSASPSASGRRFHTVRRASRKLSRTSERAISM